MAQEAKTKSAPFDRDAFLAVVDVARRAEAERLLEIFTEETGFPPRKAELSIYILPGHTDFGDILAGLGPHRLGKSCLYLRHLAAVDETALRALIRAGLHDLGKLWPVYPE
jgi:hypothetical protein